MTPSRIKITYPAHAPVEEIDLALESGFGGMGSAYRGSENRVLFVHRFEWPYDLIKAQLSVLQEKGYLSWEEAP